MVTDSQRYILHWNPIILAFVTLHFQTAICAENRKSVDVQVFSLLRTQ